MLSLSLRRYLGTALAVVSLATAACGGDDDGTGPSAPAPADVSGSYQLLRLRTLGNLGGGGNGLPVTFTDGSGSTLTFESGVLVLAQDGTYTLEVEAAFNGGGVTLTDEGTYSVAGNSIDFDSDRRSAADGVGHDQRHRHDGGDAVRRHPLRDRPEQVMEAMQASRSRVTGAYDLMKVNGRVLPAPVDETGARDGEVIRCRIMAGELRLEPDGSYHHALTARYDATGASYTRVLENGGTWRFVSSPFDESSGDVTLLSEQRKDDHGGGHPDLARPAGSGRPHLGVPAALGTAASSRPKRRSSWLLRLPSEVAGGYISRRLEGE